MYDHLILFVLAVPSMIYLFSHSMAEHRNTMTRAFVVWVITTSPIFIAAAMRDSQAPGSAGSYFGELLTFLSAREAFVYAASFLAPTFLIMYDIVKKIINDDPNISLKRFKRRAGKVTWIFYTSLVIIILTVSTYVADQISPNTTSQNYLTDFLTGKGAIIYALSLLTWYCTMLWENEESDDFEETQRRDREDFAARLQTRMTRK